MKKLLVLVVAAILTINVAAVYADSGGCGGMSKSSAKGAGCCGGDMFSKLKLTDEQKAKIEVLKADCRKATSTSEMHAVFGAGLEKILTPDQLAQWKAQCDKGMKSSGCPFMNSHGAKTDKT